MARAGHTPATPLIHFPYSLLSGARDGSMRREIAAGTTLRELAQRETRVQAFEKAAGTEQGMPR